MTQPQPGEQLVGAYLRVIEQYDSIRAIEIYILVNFINTNTV